MKFKKSVAVKIGKMLKKKTNKTPNKKDILKVYKKMKIQYARLSMQILEHKFRYYEGSQYNLTPIPDNQYDDLETKYKKITKFLNEEASACSHVGFPWDTGSGRLVASKLARNKQ